MTDAQKQTLAPLAEKLGVLREQDQKLRDKVLAYRSHPAKFPADFGVTLLKDAQTVEAALAAAVQEYDDLYASLGMPKEPWEEDAERMRQVLPSWHGRDSQMD